MCPWSWFSAGGNYNNGLLAGFGAANTFSFSSTHSVKVGARLIRHQTNTGREVHKA